MPEEKLESQISETESYESATAEEEEIEPSTEEPFVYKTYAKIDHLRYLKKHVIKAEKLNEFMDLYKGNYLN